MFILTRHRKNWGKATICFVMSVMSARNKHGSHMKFYIWVFLGNRSRKFSSIKSLKRIAGTLREDQHTFLITSRSSLLRMWNGQTKVVEKIKTKILCLITFFIFFRKCYCLSDNTEKYCRVGQATDNNMAHAGYLRLQIHTHNMQYSLLFHSNNSYTHAPQCYVIRTLPVLFTFF
jgi:hypothetical protein